MILNMTLRKYLHMYGNPYEDTSRDDVFTVSGTSEYINIADNLQSMFVKAEQ